MRRTQIYLGEDQAHRLIERGRSLERSMSELIREAIDRFLAEAADAPDGSPHDGRRPLAEDRVVWGDVLAALSSGPQPDADFPRDVATARGRLSEPPDPWER